MGIPGANKAAGPDSFDRTLVRIYGPRSARQVLVLVPGTGGGAGSLDLVARDLAARTRGLQVWAWDRRWNALEDTSVFRRGSPGRAYDYYLNGGGFSPVATDDAPFARDWGLSVTLRDLRRVVRRARAGGRRDVILGGHSLGASVAQAYASWDFGGRPGYRDIEGLVVIDGGLMSGSPPTLEELRAGRENIDSGEAFHDLLGLGIPWAAGVFSEVGGLYARKLPRQPSALQDYPLLPESLRPPFRVTNEAALGYAFDADTSPPELAGIQVQAGRLEFTGDPRHWRDAEATPIQRLAKALSTEPANFTEWYFPRRLILDLRAADALARDENAAFLGLRTWHRSKIDVPAFFFQTTLTRGRVFNNGKRFVRSTRIPSAGLVGDENMSHIDPLTAIPRENTFLQSVVPFLEAIRPGRRR